MWFSLTSSILYIKALILMSPPPAPLRGKKFAFFAWDFVGFDDKPPMHELSMNHKSCHSQIKLKIQLHKCQVP